MKTMDLSKMGTHKMTLGIKSLMKVISIRTIK